ncbi:MAG: 30S ribosomal protein S12 methylthiotransferase RimO [Lachnospiraceae bacterium]|nr:30S ribosomal protein S12 methylthiotransferase RimO [Lachnospiraceae bacterium]
MPRIGKKKVHLISLGCDKNLVDSEKTLGLMYKAGYEYCELPQEADVIIVNTCCFIRDAKEESVQTLIEMSDLKEELGETAPLLVVMGCMAERYKEEIQETLPEVDVIVGTNSWQDIVDAVDKSLAENEYTKVREFRPISDNVFVEKPVNERFITAGGHYAYLKIAEGCGKNCTYCIIPSLKGKYRSVPMEDLLKEAVSLAEDGVKELILVAQETTLYGVDLYGRKMLPELLQKLNDIEGIKWIRILYCYPEEITDELVQAIKKLPKVCHYLDIPIQHASDHILKKMARRTTHDEIISRIAKLREEIPDIVLRTTLISGFPGESDKDHNILMNFVRDTEFDRLGDFEYSREEGTKAAGLSHQVSAKTKAARRNEIMAVQQEIAVRKAEEKIGREYLVMIEGRLTDACSDSEGTSETVNDNKAAGNIYVGRTYMDAPDVDGLIYIDTGSREFMTGDMVSARVTGADGYDLIGELI